MENKGNHCRKDLSLHLVAVTKAHSPAGLLVITYPNKFSGAETLLLAPGLQFLEGPWHSKVGYKQTALFQTIPGCVLGARVSQGWFSKGILLMAVLLRNTRELNCIDAGYLVPVDLSAREWSRVRLIY